MAGVQAPKQVGSVADSHLDEIHERASGVDALYLSGRAELPSGLLTDLERARELAEGTSAPIPFELGEEWLRIAPHGWDTYRYCLTHDVYGRIGVTPSAQIPPTRVQPQSSFLHTLGPAGAVDRVLALLVPARGEVRLSVSVTSARVV